MLPLFTCHEATSRDATLTATAKVTATMATLATLATTATLALPPSEFNQAPSVKQNLNKMPPV